ncbi:MAG: acyltransferase [Anaerolineae bacterium]|nr:acyltransferase [Anaerolineae bacterium]
MSVAIRFADWALDKLLPPVRWLLFPFFIAFWVKEHLGMAVLLLSNEFIKSRLGQCGPGVRIHGRFRATLPERIFLGANVHINENAYIRAEGGLYIGDNTHISRNLVIYTTNHQYEGSLLPYDSTKILKPVHIGRNVWIGINVAITPGVTIGDGASHWHGHRGFLRMSHQALSWGTAPQQVLKMRDMDRYNHLDATNQYSGMSGFPKHPF